ncbi:hypothetical protein HMPREF9120_01336 [Neisseria sp. oral taxon 020 str. F0370]|nr:hypothetical protein HMPREF9120_01336 [Neisseria sp. oral taxon 020 str. F0370]
MLATFSAAAATRRFANHSEKFGMATAAMIAIMAIVTINSTNVKPFSNIFMKLSLFASFHRAYVPYQIIIPLF